MEKILKMFAAVIALATVPPGERDDGKLAKDLKAIESELDQAKGLGDQAEAVKTIQEAADQLRKEIDAQAAEIRRMQRMGLSLSGGAIRIPNGKSARREMLADGRAFLDDETARRFGAYMVDGTMRLLGRKDDTPPFIKDIADSVRKDMDVDVDASGAYVIPDEFRAELIRNVEAEGVLFTKCRRIPLLTVGTVKIPKRTAGLTAYWTAPATQGTRSTPTFDLVNLTAEKLMALVAYPNEFNRSALLIDLGNFLATEIVYAMSYAIDDALVNGDGTAAYGGITGILQSANITAVAATATHTTMAAITGTDVSSVIAGMTVAYGRQEAEWGMSISVQGVLRALKDDNGNPLYLRGDVKEPSTIDGYPYDVSPRMPAAATVTATPGSKYAFYGDLRKSHIVGMLRDIEIARSDQALFESDMSVVRGIMHLDIQEQDADAIVTAKTAAA